MRAHAQLRRHEHHAASPHSRRCSRRSCFPRAAAGSPGGETAPEAAFAQRSYAPGETASLVVWPGRTQTVRIERVGLSRRDPLAGAAVTEAEADHGSRARSGSATGRAACTSPTCAAQAGSAGHRSSCGRRRLGEHRIAVVLPTNTWQAYNRRDVDGNGVGDTWYADSSVASVDLTRPYLDGGVPPKFRGYDRGFLRWLAQRRIAADYLADDDLERVSGDRLARAYDLIVFPGHEEYVTTHAYDVVERYRDLGGNLMFLSANNFFYRVDRRGSRLFRTGGGATSGGPSRRSSASSTSTGTATTTRTCRTWSRRRRLLGLPGDGPSQRRPLRQVRDRDRRPYVAVAAGHPCARPDPGRVRPGQERRDDLLRDRRGAKVFAAGVINFGGSALWPHVVAHARQPLAAARGAPSAASTIPYSRPSPTR